MRKLTKTAITVATMATMALGTVASIQADDVKNGWVGSGTNYEYYNEKGEKQTNRWVKAGEDWYFLDSDGKMAVNSFIRTDAFTSESEVLGRDDVNDLWARDDFDDDSTFYFVDSSGKMVTGWVQIDSSSIYLSPNSSKNSKIWYYFSPTGDTKGAMYTNAWIQSGEDWYAVGENGQMYTNAKLPGNLKEETSYYAVEETENTDVYYVDSNGKMVKGWYKTVKADTDPSIQAYRGNNAIDVFSDKDKYIYADPNTGALAWNEWVNDGNTWYYIGTDIQEDGKKDDNLAFSVYKNELLQRDNFPNIADELDGMSPYEAKNLDKKFAMLEDKVIKWTNHNADTTNYFYLKKDSGAMLSNAWYEYDDDFYLWANNKGELAYNKVTAVNGRYYYFNSNGICDYKTLNTEADYAVKLPTGKFVFYNTDAKIATDKNVGNLNISELKNEKNDILAKDKYTFGTRTVKRASMTDLQAVLAYAAEDNGVEDIGNLEIFKLRNSTTMKATVKFDEPVRSSELGEVSLEAKPIAAVTYKGAATAYKGTVSPEAIKVDFERDENNKVIEAIAELDLKKVNPIINEKITFTKNTYAANVDVTAVVDEIIAEINKETGLKLTRENIDFEIGADIDFSIKKMEDTTTEVIVSKLPENGNVFVDNISVAKGVVVSDLEDVRLDGEGTYEFTVKSSKKGYNAVERTIKITIK